MTHKNTLDRRRAAGLCRCGGEPTGGKKSCDKCIGKAAAATRAKMTCRKAAGLCRCGEPPRPGLKMCGGCAVAHAQAVSAVQKRHRTAGKCACGNLPAEEKDSCERCLKRRQALTRKHKANGVCVSCQCRPAESGHASCDLCFEKTRTTGKAIRSRYRKDVMGHYGGECACCGESEDEFLSIDHKDNDGAKHRRVVNGSRLYRWLMKNDYPGNFQILCMNCNWAKGRYGMCPHERLRIVSLVS